MNTFNQPLWNVETSAKAELPDILLTCLDQFVLVIQKKEDAKMMARIKTFLPMKYFQDKIKQVLLICPSCLRLVTSIYIKILVFIYFLYIIIFFIVFGTSSSSSVYQNDVERFGSRYAHSGIVTRNHFQSDVEKSPWLKVTEFNFKYRGYW